MAQSPGSVLAHYRLVEKIGEGGMGEVWKARDEHLDRDVAVKVLTRVALDDATTRQRFCREAHVLSRLSHPGVATIFDFDAQDGVDFLVMEYVAGHTLQARLLDGPLELEEVFGVGAEIGDALDDAHRRGFLHRDLKPGNVALTTSGKPKLLDFGLARLLQDAQTVTALTRSGTILGSLAYMAPEQLLGGEDDVRTDVYALGALLFEMTTGRRPFHKERAEALMFEILNSAPQSVRALRPEAPLELERLLLSCLSKDAALRPTSAGSVSEALRRLGDVANTGTSLEPGREVIRSLAVLPLENVSKDAAQEYFADGMTEALISDLARIKALRVISRTSAMKYKGAHKALPDIARELNVDAVLEGSALLVGNRVRVSVRLVSARTDETLWTDRYDRNLEDVLGLQGEVAETVAKEIAIQVAPREATRLSKRSAVNAEAHVEYLKGRYAVAAASPQATDLSLRHFRRALELDPSFAPAWAGLAECHNIRASRGMAPPAEANVEARAAAMKALELDESLAEAHAALARVKAYQRDFAGAIASSQRAIELNPGLASTYYILGQVFFCSERHAEAQQAMLKALSLDPLSMLIHTTVGDAYYYAREYEKSVVYYRMAIEIDPRFDGAHTDLARSLEALGRFDEARFQYEEGRRLSGGVAGPSFGLAHLEASRGHESEARRMLEELVAARAQRVVSAWASPRCTRASATWTRRSAGWTSRWTSAPRDSSSCVSTRASMPSARMLATKPCCERSASIPNPPRPPSSDQRHLDAEDWRERIEEAAPLLPAVAPDPELPGGGPEVERRRLEFVDAHRVAQDREVARLLRQPLCESPPRAAAIFAAPHRGRAAGTGAGHRLERHHVERVGIVGVHDQREAEVGRQPLGDRAPAVAVVVAAQHADVRPPPSRSVPLPPAAVVLHVEPARGVLMASDLVHALAELGVGIGREAGADALVGGLEGLAAVLREVVPAGRDTEVHAIAVAQDRVHAQSAITGLPLARVLVVADALDHFP